MNDSLKIRVAGTKLQVELITEQLREWSKQWGKRKIFKVKRYDRKKKTGSINKFHLTFGARRFVNYIEMKLPEYLKKLSGLQQQFGGDTGIDADFQWPAQEEQGE